MANRLKVSPGDVYGRLTVSERAPNRGERTVWKCLCECGTVCEVPGHEMTRADRPGSKSCGCLREERFKARVTTHGMTKTTEFRILSGIKARCTDPHHAAYARYGGRGISYDPSWERFENFYADMGPRPEGKTLDRIDNDKGYSKDNCKWATQKEQANNRGNSRLLEFNGKTQTLTAWAEELLMKPGTLQRRLSTGSTVEEALTKPVRGYRKTQTKKDGILLDTKFS